MKRFLIFYAIGGGLWLLYSNSQGYSTTLAQKLLWPITAFRQFRDTDAPAA